MRANVINLQETWCSPEDNETEYQMQGYQLHMVNQGRGKGIATYYSNEFEVSGTINKELYQMLKIKGSNFDVINVYCSRGANRADFLRDLGSLAAAQRPCLITGDFNINYMKDPKDSIVARILSCGFNQIVKGPTHKDGGLLDHIYTKRLGWEPRVHMNFPYYSDHAAIAVSKP